MKNKTQLAWPLPPSMHVQSGGGVTVDSIDDGVFGHDEADITIISYMLQAANDGCHVVRVLIDGTDIFVLLVYWTWRCDLHDRLAVQMEKWDGVVLDVTATCAHLGSIVCSQLLGAHAIRGQVLNKGGSTMLEHQVCAKSARTCSLQQYVVFTCHPRLWYNVSGILLLLLSAFPIRGRHSGFSFSSFSYQLYPPPSLQPQPCPLSPHP